MGLLELLKPAPHVPEIQDPELVQKNYKYWRFRIFYGMYIGYVFYYFTRKSFTFAMPILMKDLGLQISDLGILSSILAITYGISKFLSGIMADRSNPRFFMATGLILTGVCNILFGLSSSVIFFAVFWGLNGWFQGWGWPPCARLLTHWYSQKERGTWWGFWNTSHSVGGLLIPLLAGFLAQYVGWRYALYVPGALCILVGFFLINRLRDTPQSLGLPSIEKFRNDYPAVNRAQDENELSTKEILFKHVLTNKYIWILAAAYFFVYIIREAVNNFGALFLMETKHYALLTANTGVLLFEAGGVCGSLAAGWASDRIFDGRRGPVNILFSAAVIFALAALYMGGTGVLTLDYLLMFTIGFLIFGPQMLIGMAAAELSHKKAAGTATGFTGWIAYLGAAVAGWPISTVIESWGWRGFFLALCVCGALSVLTLLPLWAIKTHPKYTQPAISDIDSESVET